MTSRFFTIHDANRELRLSISEGGLDVTVVHPPQAAAIRLKAADADHLALFLAPDLAKLRNDSARIRLSDAIVANNATSAELLTRAEEAEQRAAAAEERAAMLTSTVRQAENACQHAAVRALAAENKFATLEREREDWRGSARLWKGDHDVQKARAEAAESRLATLVGAWNKLADAGVAPRARITVQDHSTAPTSHEVRSGDVYALQDRSTLVNANTILLVTEPSDVNRGGTCRVEPYVRTPGDSWYPRSSLGQLLARRGET